ncbi:MAG: hypothetical protein WBA13_05650 [Microcoleaceae cyanobacterium]
MKTTDLDNISLAAFQQPINCCNVTAIAYALTALGHLPLLMKFSM